MSEDIIMRNIHFVFYGENAWRGEARLMNGTWQVRIDVHQMPAAEAKKMIRNLIVLMPGALQLCVVHGYHGGTAIKDTLRSEYISNRIYHMETPAYNPGITWMEITDRLGQQLAA